MSKPRAVHAAEVHDSGSPWPGWPVALVATGWPVWVAIVLTIAAHLWLGPGLLLAMLILGAIPLGFSLWLAIEVPGSWCQSRDFSSATPRRWLARWGLTLAHMVTVLAVIALLLAWRIPAIRALFTWQIPPASTP